MKKSRPRCLRGVERVVEAADRVGRQDDRQREVGERLHVVGRELRCRGRAGPSNATMKFLNASSELYGGPALVSLPKKPSTRSPRQCIAPWLTMPRRVCVVIGPFIGCRSATSPVPLIAARAEAIRPSLMVIGCVDDVAVGVAEVPRQLVDVAEDVAARARRLAVATT